MELAAPFESQAAVVAAIDCYRTPTEIAQAHANCLAILQHLNPLDPGDRIFLSSCFIALRDKLSFGHPFAPSIPPEGVIAAPALNGEAAGAIS